LVLSVAEAYPPELLAIARRVVWFKEPAETLADTVYFLTYFMQYGTAEDYVTLMRHFTPLQFRHGVENAYPGIMDARWWAFWCVRYLGQADVPMPMRVLP
jgi:hypothetical protein